MLTKLLLFVLTAITTLVLALPAELSNTGQVPNVSWSVKRFTRYCDSFLHGCVYTFFISRNGAPDFKCEINNAQTSPESPGKQSWYAVPCNLPWNPEEGWEISWGYNSNSDTAVMTVVNKNLKNIAWFGWGNINKKTSYPDVGPNAVYTI